MTSWAGSLIYTWRKTELSHCSLTFLDYHIKPPGSLIPNTNRPPMLALSLRNWCLIKVPFKFDKIVQRLTGRNFIFQFWQNHTECNLCKSEPGQYLPCAGITTRGSPYSLLISTDRDEHEGTWNYKNAHDKNLIHILIVSCQVTKILLWERDYAKSGRWGLKKISDTLSYKYDKTQPRDVKVLKLIKSNTFGQQW